MSNPTHVEIDGVMVEIDDSPQNLADQVYEAAHDEDGEYHRANADREVRELGGVLVSSANDRTSLESFSPTEDWLLPDGSKITIASSWCG